MLSNFLPKNGVYTSQKLVESCGVEKGREGKKDAKARTRFHNNKGNFEAAKNPERKKKKKKKNPSQLSSPQILELFQVNIPYIAVVLEMRLYTVLSGFRDIY